MLNSDVCTGTRTFSAGKFEGTGSLKGEGNSAPTTQCANCVHQTIRSFSTTSAESKTQSRTDGGL